MLGKKLSNLIAIFKYGGLPAVISKVSKHSYFLNAIWLKYYAAHLRKKYKHVI